MNLRLGGTDGDEKSRTPVIMQSGYFCAISANFANIEGGCCPSASSVTACVNPRSAAAEKPVFNASAFPLFCSERKTSHL